MTRESVRYLREEFLYIKLQDSWNHGSHVCDVVGLTLQISYCIAAHTRFLTFE